PQTCQDVLASSAKKRSRHSYKLISTRGFCEVAFAQSGLAGAERIRGRQTDGQHFSCHTIVCRWHAGADQVRKSVLPHGTASRPDLGAEAGVDRASPWTAQAAA